MRTAHADDLDPPPAYPETPLVVRRVGRRRMVDLDGTTFAAPGRARAEVLQILTAWRVPPQASADLLVIVSELVTNATVHPAQPDRVAVLVAHESRAVRVAVIGPATSKRLTASLPDQDAEGGRGLAVVDAYVDVWGHRVYGTQRSMVWAVVRFPEPSAVSTAPCASASGGAE
ncbi:hypothetical protein AQI95_41810 [Streptomyces yokosukanensis]|uniref:Histidine kinase/HSP90-like ATPase domain-containing protein n=1 Tax=Streptomyces yokosukanensis TaxID=67386 RepID=A0A101NQ41_9ACTN|nr:ATP-binding protein [Streptomyces yokosukanensis]KUM97359.1 hypothetical protein AQI95_41810 [Streptomyces yokosukanensis]